MSSTPKSFTTHLPLCRDDVDRPSSFIAESEDKSFIHVTRYRSQSLRSELNRKPLRTESDIASSLSRPVGEFDENYQRRRSELTEKHTLPDHFKATPDSILQVYPAYRADDTNVTVFAVVTKTKPDNISLKDIPLVHRRVDEYNNEGLDVTKYRLNNNIYLTEEDATKLQKCIQKNSEQLMKEHTNLTMISGCTCRSAKYGSDKQEFSKETCIVLYVRMKGLIPIGEKPFKTQIDGIPVDVREGGFQFSGGSKTRQNRLRIGSQISSSNTGTLGMFIDYKNTTCCLTSAHVVLDDDSMEDLKNTGHKEWEFENAPEVYQPDSRESNDMFGHVVQALYRKGENNKAGIEIALIAINKRHPDTGQFPEQEGIDGNSQLQFSSGQICDRYPSPIGSEVLMYGAATQKITTGRVSFILNIGEVPLLNQIIVESKEVFGQSGDSGALVFRKFQEFDSDPELKALGIYEGNTHDNKYVITPIWDILEVLSHPHLTNFETLSLKAKVEKTIDKRLQKLEDITFKQTSKNNC